MITDEQYERWHDFSIRMAQTCFKRKRNPSPAEIEANVEFFFDCLDEQDLCSIVDWDNSDPYPEGSPRHGTDYYGHPNSAMLVTDMCKEQEEAWNPHYWEAECGTKREQRWYDQFVMPVVCCIRAGLDAAIRSGPGVMGCTAGDLRRMYPEGVPDWVTGGPDHRWSYAFSGRQNGTFPEMADNAAIML